MKRTFCSFKISDPQEFKLKMLNWSNRFNICCFLDDHQYHLPGNKFDCVVAAGAIDVVNPAPGQAFANLEKFHASSKDWIFGHLSYDLKNEIEDLSSTNPDHVGFPDLFFFVPRVIIRLKDDEVSIGVNGTDDASLLFEELSQVVVNITSFHNRNLIDLQSRFNKDEYIATVELLKKHIHRGDCYVINFCQEFFAENVELDALKVFLSLDNLSPNPFSAFYRINDKYCLCSSPERYLRKDGDRLLSQPIKGTSPRNFLDPGADEKNKQSLVESRKERSENVMVVDLVRNDLSKVCDEGSVKVTELFGVYSFPNVHQMISSIEGNMKKNLYWIDALKATFPMGSMTGAPKKKVMELAEQYERTKRGLYSGAIGYVDPGGNFDFNVVIRSILYNSTSGYLSYQTGSAITFESDPEKEYEECLLKGEAMRSAIEIKEKR